MAFPSWFPAALRRDLKRRDKCRRKWLCEIRATIKRTIEPDRLPDFFDVLELLVKHQDHSSIRYLVSQDWPVDLCVCGQHKKEKP